MIAGIIKAFNFPIDYVLYELSYANMMLYSASLPTYRKPKNKDKTGQRQETIDAGDPRNKDKVRAFLNQME